VARHQTDAELHKAVRAPPERETGMITLWDGWAIGSDEYQLILGKPENRNLNGRIIVEMKRATYHGTLGKALESFYNHQVRESIKENDSTLCQALVVASQIEKRIREIIREPDFQP